MTDKKRKTVTTIERHEVWIIRKGVPEPADEAVTISPIEIAPPGVSSSSELDESSEASKEQGS